MTDFQMLVKNTPDGPDGSFELGEIVSVAALPHDWGRDERGPGFRIMVFDDVDFHDIRNLELPVVRSSPYRVNGFAVDDDLHALFYSFVVTPDDDGPSTEQSITLTGEDFPAAMLAIKGMMCAAAQAQADANLPIDIDPYTIIKDALTQGAMTRSGRRG